MLMIPLLPFLCLCCVVLAGQQVFEALPKPLRVAVVGAGAAGSSQAYFLNFLQSQFPSVEFDVTLYEKSGYVGGRSTTVSLPYENTYAELGASIFSVPNNLNLAKAVQEFGLELQDGHGDARLENARMAIFDGESYIFEDSNWAWGYWDKAKILWKYGLAPLRMRSTLKSVLASFVQLYSPRVQSMGPFRSIPAFADSLNFTKMYQSSGSDYLREAGVSNAFVTEMIAAGTTVNYNQSPSQMHALLTMVSLAAEGAASAVGGNRLIFENFVNRSRATLRLNENVISLSQLDGNPATWEVTSTTSDEIRSALYDVVVLASPYHQSDISIISPTFIKPIPPQAYSHLHVTLLVTNATSPQACFFNPHWSCKDPAPTTILSTFAPFEQGKSKIKPIINSLNYLRQVAESEFAVKLFSREKMTEADLNHLFGEGNVLWTHRKEWDAYPQSGPMQPEEFSPIQLGEGLYYANAFEPLISTMETETVSSWNIAGLIMQDHFGIGVGKSWAQWDD